MNFLQKTSEYSVKDYEGAIVTTQFLAIVSLFLAGIATTI
ncbi:hypothetical protein BCE_3006 [Bacillus cereus ATCC 10987]|jgi:hypothetical protein|uniref:Uncharacterized protein n=1 Tax=Bacillus cereus (strain ATCC 10987 / NRS 248) TaxID=222523 RepID=Q735Z5_BACC1|nr:hypothetical protein BCE_3006 [Bacillus cereus ATCC 10987]